MCPRVGSNAVTTRRSAVTPSVPEVLLFVKEPDALTKEEKKNANEKHARAPQQIKEDWERGKRRGAKEQQRGLKLRTVKQERTQKRENN